MEGGTPQALNGPLWWYLVFMYVAAVGFAAYVSIDSRRGVRAPKLAALREPAWIYRWFQPVFLVLVVVALLPVLPRILSVVPVGLTPVAIAGQVAYLLRVVFPKPSEVAEVAAADAGEGLQDSALECPSPTMKTPPSKTI